MRLNSSWFIYMSRRMFFSLAAFGLAWLTGCSPAPETPLRVATIPWPGYESVHLAQSLSYFQPSQIRLAEMANASQVSLALRNGTVEAGFLTLDETLSLIQDGIDLRVVLVVDISNGADAVVSRPGITNLQALRGKRVAVESSAVGAIMLDAMLAASGLEVSDVQLITATVDTHTKVYQSGDADVVVTFEPARTALLKQGARLLFDSSRIPGRILDVLVVRGDQVHKHRHALKNLVAAHFRALNYQSQQPQDAAKRIAHYLGVPEAEVASQYDGLKIPSLKENHTLLSGTQPALEKIASDLADLMLHRNLLKRQVNTGQLVDPMFLPTND